jgi:hypothetical protein
VSNSKARAVSRPLQFAQMLATAHLLWYQHSMNRSIFYIIGVIVVIVIVLKLLGLF